MMLNPFSVSHQQLIFTKDILLSESVILFFLYKKTPL